jgi:hypothetical protein
MPTSRGWAGILDADEMLPGVAQLRVLVGGGTVPTTGTQRPSRVHLLAECREGRG